jgi:hypothetical protein
MRSNYKTTECYFFAQNRCTRGDECTFKHGDNDHLAPPREQAPPPPIWTVSMPRTDKEEEVELVKNLKITAWMEYPRQHYYCIEGKDDECMKYYTDYILPEFPTNPYFTRIVEEGEGYIKVSRSTTSD